jgi:hypothetical protein
VTITTERFTIGKFTLTHHAMVKMLDRKVTLDQLRVAVLEPGLTYASLSNDSCVVQWSDTCGAVVDPEQGKVVTVLVAGSSKADDDARRAAELRLEITSRSESARTAMQNQAEIIRAEKAREAAEDLRDQRMVAKNLREVEEIARDIPVDQAPKDFSKGMDEYLKFWHAYYRLRGWV